MRIILRLLLFGCGALPGSLIYGADLDVEEVPLTPEDRQHWAYRPLTRPSIPVLATEGWQRTPVDAFVLARLEPLGLTGCAEANRPALLRRLAFDLTGLPPTLEEREAFLQDDAPNAVERLVERLLASPAYGERWGQHWLDLARFAETDGFEHDKLRADAWRYRDWVIAALNRDLPYDEFLRQQLAGDELAGGDPIATMFCLAGPDMPDVNDQVERRHLRLNELTSTVGAVFLGMQVGCAECHDHKYDPISQADFYRLRAVFESSVPAVFKRDAPYYRFANQPERIEARLWIRGDYHRPGAKVEPSLPRIAAVSTQVDQFPTETSAGLRTALAEALIREAQALTARVIVNRVWKHHFGRGLSETPSDFGLINADPTHPELLDWLADDLITHGWSLKHLHRRLVLSATYRQASHRSDRIDADWDMRLACDPDNRWLSRAPRRRLDGEALRDALLDVSGVLNRTAGGPGVQAPLPEELVSTLLKGQWTTHPNAAEHVRRSVYLFARRNLRYPLLEAFDRPDANASCAARGRSTTAPQSLTLLNSDLSVEAAQRLAGRVLHSSPSTEARLQTLYRITLSRDPLPDELQFVKTFLTANAARLTADTGNKTFLMPLPTPVALDSADAASWVDLCLAVLNSNEFLYCD